MKRLFLYAVVFASLAGGGALSAEAATYYVAVTGGDDARACTIAQDINTPRKTIRGGLGCIKGGDRLEIRGGVYTDAGIRTSSNPALIPSGTSWTNATRIGGYQSETVTWNVSANGFGIDFNSSNQYIILENLILDGSAFRNIKSKWSTDGIKFGDGVHHIRLKNIESRYWTGGGGDFTPAGDPSAGGLGIVASRFAHHLELIGVNAHHNGNKFAAVQPSVYKGHGIYFSADDSLIENSIIHDNTSLGIQFYSGYDDLDGRDGDRVSRNIFRNNRVYDNGKGDQGAGVAVDGDDNLIYNNIIYNNPSTGIAIGYSPSSASTKIFNNIIYNNSPGIQMRNANAVNTQIKNNILFGNGISNLGDPSPVYSNNFCSASGLGCAIVGDPKFINPTTFDFHLQSSSPAINTGATLTEFATDFDNKTRIAPWDIGAYEFAAAITPPSASTVSISASPSTINSGQSSTLTWSSANATSCTASGGWTGTKSTSGTQTVTPSANTTYTLSCTGAGGTTIQGTTVTVSPVNSAAGAFYVATTGNDANSCTSAQNIATPKRTIASGLTCMSAGKTLYIRGGTYAERISSITQTLPTGTSWANAPVIAGYPGEKPTLKPLSGENIILLNGTSIQYMIFENLVLDGIDLTDNATSDAGINFSDPVHHIRFKNIEIKNVNKGSVSADAKGHGVLGSANDIEFINMNIHDNGNSDFDHGLYIKGNRILIENSDIYNNAGWGIHKYPEGDNHIYRNNKIHNNARVGPRGAGIGLYGGIGTQVYNNLIWDNTIGVAVNYSEASSKIFNNTIYSNTDSGVNIGSGISGISIKNNIVYSNGTNIINNGSNAVLSNNLCSTSGTGCTLTANTSPFVNAAGADFHLLSGVSAINAGVTLSEFNIDFDGTSRPVGSAWDIGAYEFAAAITPPPASLTALKSSVPLAIDGLLSESAWTQSSSVTFSNSSRSDNSVVVSSLWDDTNLYIGYNVTDVHLEAVGGPLYQDDGAELYLDTANNKSASMDADDYQFIATINDLASNAGITSRKQNRTGGYTMEIQIPWSVVAATPSAGKTLGLLLANNDRDLNMTKQFDWLNLIATGSYTRPNLWGSLVLSGTLTTVPTTNCTPTYNPNSLLPVGFASPFNIVSNPSQALMGINCTSSAATATFGNAAANTYIYKTGYILKNNVWQAVPLSGSTSASPDWFLGSATADLPLTQAELSSQQYFLSYQCQLVGIQWKCGCLTSACDAAATPKTGGLWMLQGSRR